MNVITYGDGKIETCKGLNSGLKCLILIPRDEPQIVGAITPAEIAEKQIVPETATIIEFKTLESARVLQDKLNLLICEWSEAEAPRSTIQLPSSYPPAPDDPKPAPTPPDAVPAASKGF